MHGVNVLVGDSTRYVIWFSSESDRERYIKDVKKKYPDGLGGSIFKFHKIPYAPRKILIIENQGKSIKDIYDKVNIRSVENVALVPPLQR